MNGKRYTPEKMIHPASTAQKAADYIFGDGPPSVKKLDAPGSRGVQSMWRAGPAAATTMPFATARNPRAFG